MPNAHAAAAKARAFFFMEFIFSLSIISRAYFQSRKTLFKKKAGVNTVASTSVFVLMVGSLSLD